MGGRGQNSGGMSALGRNRDAWETWPFGSNLEKIDYNIERYIKRQGLNEKKGAFATQKLKSIRKQQETLHQLNTKLQNNPNIIEIENKYDYGMGKFFTTYVDKRYANADGSPRRRTKATIQPSGKITYEYLSYNDFKPKNYTIRN